jgi:hypothetical protein
VGSVGNPPETIYFHGVGPSHQSLELSKCHHTNETCINLEPQSMRSETVNSEFSARLAPCSNSYGVYISFVTAEPIKGCFDTCEASTDQLCQVWPRVRGLLLAQNFLCFPHQLHKWPRMFNFQNLEGIN